MAAMVSETLMAMIGATEQRRWTAWRQCGEGDEKDNNQLATAVMDGATAMQRQRRWTAQWQWDGNSDNDNGRCDSDATAKMVMAMEGTTGCR